MENTDTHATETAASPSVEELAFMFRHTARLMVRGRERGPFSHPGQGRVLRLLRERGPLNRRVLMDMLGVRSGSLSELLGKLERQNLITKNRDDNDRRGFIVATTEKGNDMIATTENTAEERPEAIFACLTEEERAQLGVILAKLIANGDDVLYMTEEGPGRHGRCHGMGRRFGHDCHGHGLHEHGPHEHGCHGHGPHGHGSEASMHHGRTGCDDRGGHGGHGGHGGCDEHGERGERAGCHERSERGGHSGHRGREGHGGGRSGHGRGFGRGRGNE